jgi:Transposase DNA-binding
MTTWASEELPSVELGDQRLNNRLKVLVETLASCPEGSIPQACNGDPAGLKAAYRVFDNDRVEASKILAGQVASTCTRGEGHATILAIQDTTSLEFTQHRGTHGLGYLEADYWRGIKVHSVFGVSPEGIPLGI